MAAVLHLLGPCPMPLEPEYNCCMCSSLCMPKLIQQIFSSVFFYINNNIIMEWYNFYFHLRRQKNNIEKKDSDSCDGNRHMHSAHTYHIYTYYYRRGDKKCRWITISIGTTHKNGLEQNGWNYTEPSNLFWLCFISISDICLHTNRSYVQVAERNQNFCEYQGRSPYLNHLMTRRAIATKWQSTMYSTSLPVSEYKLLSRYLFINWKQWKTETMFLFASLNVLSSVIAWISEI